jgi:polyisoprenoid-binding protein YceI
MKKIAIGLFLFSFTASAAVQTLKPNGGQVSMLAQGKPNFIKIEGIGSAPTGAVTVDGTKIEGEFKFDLATLDTKNDTRNDHMKNRYLEVAQYPQAVLAIKKVATPGGWSLEKPAMKDIPFEGMLTMHGETKPVTGTLSVTEKKAVTAKFHLNMPDFKVQTPRFAGITVADGVDVEVTINEIN